MALSWTAFKRPKVVLAVTEIVLALIALTMLLAYKGLATLHPTSISGSSQSWAGMRMKFSFPFRSASSEIWGYKDSSPQKQEELELTGGIKTSSNYLLVVFVLSAFLACVRLLLYALLRDSVLKQRLPPFEVFATGVTSVMMFVGSVLFVYHVKSKMSVEIQERLDIAFKACKHEFSAECVISNSSSVYGALYGCATFGFFLTVAWALSGWFAYRKTYLHHPYYVQQVERTGTGPGVHEVAGQTAEGPVEGLELQAARTVGGDATSPTYGAAVDATEALSF